MYKKRNADPAYSPKQVYGFFGVEYNTILYWVRIKLVRASVRSEAKQWSPVLFSFEDLVEIRFVQHLRFHGVSTSRIIFAVRVLRKALKTPSVVSKFFHLEPGRVDVLGPEDVLRVVSSRTATLLINTVFLQTEVMGLVRPKHSVRLALALSASHVSMASEGEVMPYTR